MLGQHDQAAEAERKPGPGAAPAGTQLMSGGFRATARDGFRFTSPGILRPEPGIQVARGCDFGDLAFITTSGGVAAMDAGTTRHRACPLPGAGRGNSRRADGPPSGERRAARRRRDDAPPGAAVGRRRLPGRAPGDPRLIGSLRPRLLSQGHPALTEVFTAEAAAGPCGGTDPAARRGARAALPPAHRLLAARQAGTRAGDRSRARRRTRPAGRRQTEQSAAAATLIGQGDYALALEIIQPGLLRHPASTTLAGLRPTAPHRLIEAYQQFDPFKFLIYAELASAEIGPVE